MNITVMVPIDANAIGKNENAWIIERMLALLRDASMAPGLHCPQDDTPPSNTVACGLPLNNLTHTLEAYATLQSTHVR